MNSKFLIIFFLSFIYSQYDITTKQYSFFKSNEINEIDFSQIIDDINGKYSVQIISVENADFKKRKRTLIENCDINFSIYNDKSDIIISRCNDKYNYNGSLLIDDEDYIVLINNDKYNYLNCTIIFWISGSFVDNTHTTPDLINNGILNEFYEDGTLYIQYNFKNGKKNGIQKRWYQNGQLEIIYNYKNGKLEGLQKKWYDSGILKGEWNYNDDRLHGTVKEWYPNNQLKFIKVYNDGSLTKVLEHFNPDGSIVQ